MVRMFSSKFCNLLLNPNFFKQLYFLLQTLHFTLGLKAARDDALVHAQEVLAHLVGRQLQLQDDRRVVAGDVKVGERLVPGGHDGALALARMQAANAHLVVRLADPDLGLRQPLWHAQRAVRSDGEAALQNAPVDVLQVLLLKPDNAGAGVAHHTARLHLLRFVALAGQRLQFVLDDGLGHLRVALRAQVDGVLLAHFLSEVDHALQFSVEHLRRVHVVLAVRLQVGALLGRDQLVGLDREVLHGARVHAPAVNFQADLPRRDIDHVDVIPRSDVDTLLARHAPRRKIALDDLVGEVFELRAVRAVNRCGKNDQVVAETIETDRCVRHHHTLQRHNVERPTLKHLKGAVLAAAEILEEREKIVAVNLDVHDDHINSHKIKTPRGCTNHPVAQEFLRLPTTGTLPRRRTHRSRRRNPSRRQRTARRPCRTGPPANSR